MTRTARVVLSVIVWIAGAAWVTIPHRWEGPVIATFSVTHGLHRNDLWGILVPLVICLALWTPWRRPER